MFHYLLQSDLSIIWQDVYGMSFRGSILINCGAGLTLIILLPYRAVVKLRNMVGLAFSIVIITGCQGSQSNQQYPPSLARAIQQNPDLQAKLLEAQAKSQEKSQEEADSWINATEAEVKSRWGTPDKKETDGQGGSLYEYDTQAGSSIYARIFSIGKDGLVYNVNWHYL